MPPKRKAGGKAATAAGKKAKTEAQPSPTLKKAMFALKKVGSFSKKTHKPDAKCPIMGVQVWQDYDAMLNQANIIQNNNKFYIIQVLKSPLGYFAWNRWGRVGENGQNSQKGPFAKVEDAIKDFEKKFLDKTRNHWSNRASFNPVKGKYTLLEMGEDEDEPTTTVVHANVVSKVLPSKLDEPTQKFMKLIFNKDMFNHAMVQLKLDTKKLPLGKLSKAQIMKGFDCLDEIEKAIKSKASATQKAELTSKFYTVIPHDFGRVRPPTLNTQEEVREKMDMLLVLADIEVAQAMEKEKEKMKGGKDAALPNPVDMNYQLLDCDFEIIDSNSGEFKTIEKFTANTKGRSIQIQYIWRVNRRKEGSPFKQHDKLQNRKLLWHGTNVAVVAAILKSGLRIMPHSGGRVGKGIYFASENAKSAAYVCCAPNNIGIMFLAEVALGKENYITTDNSCLTQPPSGFDSVVAAGRTEPDPAVVDQVTLDGKKVVVPLGKPKPQPNYSNSYFGQSEYLIYKESQCRLRYCLQCKF